MNIDYFCVAVVVSLLLAVRLGFWFGAFCLFVLLLVPVFENLIFRKGGKY